MANNKSYYAENKEYYRQKNRAWREKYPWYDCWRNAHARCEDPRNKNYQRLSAAGIICTLTKEEVIFMWNRDNASSLIIASIDRIDATKNYELCNCRFFEFIDNVNRKNQIDHPLNTISEAESAWAE